MTRSIIDTTLPPKTGLFNMTMVLIHCCCFRGTSGDKQTHWQFESMGTDYEKYLSFSLLHDGNQTSICIRLI